MNYRNKLLFCLCTILGGMNIAVAADETPFAVVGEITAGKNEMGVEPGERFFTDMMIDPSLIPTLSLSSREWIRFIDPWRWHWRKWDWLRGFVIEIPRIPFPEPDPGPLLVLRIQAVYDDAQDMIGKFQAGCRLNIKSYAAILSGLTTSWGELFWVSA